MEIYFSFHNILALVWVCLGVAAACGVWLLWPYRWRLLSLKRYRQHQPQHTEAVEHPASASVIVYCRDNPDALTDLLPELLEQQYQGAWEVIVVNDGADDKVADVVNRTLTLRPQAPLRLTYVPAEARSLSRKKLALSLGIKASHSDVVVLTTAQCQINGTEWLASMMRHFNTRQPADIVLGWAAYRNLGALRRRFDQVFTATTWLTAALRGKPYRGCGANLAYRRQLFFREKGFSKWLNLHQGDDDLFVSQIAQGSRTAVEISNASRLRILAPRPRKEYRDERLNHMFTRRFLHTAAPRFMGFSSLLLWLQLAAVAVGMVFALPNALPACALFLLLLLTWWPVCRAWRSAARALGIRLRARIALWPLMWHWITTLRLRWLCTAASRRNYTWVKR